MGLGSSPVVRLKRALAHSGSTRHTSSGRSSNCPPARGRILRLRYGDAVDPVKPLAGGLASESVATRTRPDRLPESLELHRVPLLASPSHRFFPGPRQSIDRPGRCGEGGSRLRAGVARPWSRSLEGSGRASVHRLWMTVWTHGVVLRPCSQVGAEPPDGDARAGRIKRRPPRSDKCPAGVPREFD